jgi:hypothetical protein
MTVRNVLFVLLAGLLVGVLLLPVGSDDSVPVSAANRTKRKEENLTQLVNAAYRDRSDSAFSLPLRIKDPFMSKDQPGSASPPAIKRPYRLKGVLSGVSGLLAVVVDGKNESHVLSPGESFSGVTLISVEPERAFFKDAYGAFTLLQQ